MTTPVNPGNSHSENLDEILDRCLRAIERNRATIETCVARYPEYPELGDIVKTAVMLGSYSSVEMPATATAKPRQQLQAQLRKTARANNPRAGRIQILFRVAAAFMVIAIALSVGGFGLIRAAATAAPG